MTTYSQLDSRWKDIKLGFSDVTIGGYGCTITSIGMILDETPISVNERMKQVGGFAQGNLVIWEKIKEAFPNKVESVRRVWTYNNDDVKANIPCVVQVDGTPIGVPMHFVTYKGEQKLLDPWGGVERPTSYYIPQSYCVIKLKPFVQPTPPIDECPAKLKQITEERDRLNGVITDKDETISHLGDTINAKNAEIATAQTTISSLNSQVLNLTQQLATATEQAKKVSGLTTNLEACEASKQGYATDLSKCKTQVGKIKSQLIPKKYLSKKLYDIIMALE